MRIALTIPGFSLHGGIRIIMEWANRLSRLGYNVVLLNLRPPYQKFVRWFDLDFKVKIEENTSAIKNFDCLIVCSPHDADLLKSDNLNIKKKFVFCQMLEHMFRPNDKRWNMQCSYWYNNQFPMFSISKWNIDWIREKYPNRGPIHYIGNGVNFDDFPIEKGIDRGKEKIILVEGWNCLNPTKDQSRIAHVVSGKLQNKGCKILAYSQTPFKKDPWCVPDKFYCKPSIEELNMLYRTATILLKASRYDARSCSPMEAMTKGCIPVRAIIEGDDDLIDEENCLRVSYDQEKLFNATVHVLKNSNLRDRLSKRCIKYVQEYSWDYWMPIIEKVLCDG